MNTTSHYRAMAAGYETSCDWNSAADAWQKAISLYPARFRTSAIGNLDIEKMTARLTSCRHMAKAAS